MIKSFLLCLAFAVFAADPPFLASASPMNHLISVVCGRNPALEMCGGAGVRAKDAPLDEDTRSMRSFPKVSYDDLQLDRYCARHRDHYGHFCRSGAHHDGALGAKLAKFCPSFEEYCPELAGASAPHNSVQQEVAAPLVIPPPLPGKRRNSAGLAFDSPLPQDKDEAPLVVLKPLLPLKPLASPKLTPAMVATCTAECTAPHCTTECKCANTHPSVHAMCNPPANAELASTCQRWYSKCPMFKPLQY